MKAKLSQKVIKKFMNSEALEDVVVDGELGKGLILSDEEDTAIILLFPKNEYECFCLTTASSQDGEWKADENNQFYNIDNFSINLNKAMTKGKVSFTIEMEL